MVRGVVEGFYGRPFRGGRRSVLIGYLSVLEDPAYVYAPKNDPFHRIGWREDRPEEDWTGLRSDMELARDIGVSFIFGVSPWGFSDGEHSLLRRRVREALSAGASGIAVLFDDIPQPVDPLLAGRQLRFAARALDGIDCPVYVCPTVYCGELLERYGGEDYLAAWRRGVPDGWRSFWTGEAVISKELDGHSLSNACELLGGRPAIWDNILADDYSLRRIYLNDLTGRVPEDHDYFINPSDCFPAALHGLHRLIGSCGIEQPWPEELGRNHEAWTILEWFHDTPWSVSDEAAGLMDGIRRGMADGADPAVLEMLENCRNVTGMFLDELETLPWGYELAPYVRDLWRLFGQWHDVLMLASPDRRLARMEHRMFSRLPFEHPLAGLAWELRGRDTGGDPWK